MSDRVVPALRFRHFGNARAARSGAADLPPVVTNNRTTEIWRPAARLLDRSLPGLILATLCCAYWRTLAPGITWANSGTDSGDLVTAAATLGVAHPTGYPTYLLLARLFQFLPLGDLAFRVNLLSAAAAALAALCVYLLVRRLLAGQGWPAPAAAAIAALSLGFSAIFWSQAVVAEVYSLHALFTASIMLWTFQSTVGAESGMPHKARLVLRPASSETRRCNRLQALAVGLALGNHITIAPLAAAWLLTGARGPAGARLLAQRALWLGAGALVYLYLPLRATAQPPVNWGMPRDWAGLWWVVSGQPYRALAFGLSPGQAYARVAAWAALLAQQFGWIGIGLGFLGLFYGAAHARPFVRLTLGLSAISTAFALGYDTADSYVYLIPVYIFFGVWIGLGVQVALKAATRWKPPAAALAAALLIAELLWRVPATAHAVDASGDRRAIDYAARALAATPARAIVFTQADRDTFALWYYHYALGVRLDLVVIAEPLLEFAWYRDNLRAVYPGLQVPEQRGLGWATAIVAANPERTQSCRADPDGAQAVTCTDRRAVAERR